MAPPPSFQALRAKVAACGTCPGRALVYTRLVVHEDSAMLRNITLSAEDKLIEAARKRASEQNTTLNAEFRKWLEDYARTKEEGRERVRRFREMLTKLEGKVEVGRKLTRDEMNER